MAGGTTSRGTIREMGGRMWEWLHDGGKGLILFAHHLPFIVTKVILSRSTGSLRIVLGIWVNFDLGGVGDSRWIDRLVRQSRV